MIEKKLLEEYGADNIQFLKGDYIFEKGSTALYYFQIESGGVKMNSYSDNGSEFIQGIFGKNKSFGEPPLLIDTKYPANAISIENSKIYRLKKDSFIQLLLENNKVHYHFTKMISNRLYFKATMANGISSNSAEEAVLTLFNYLKQEVYEKHEPFSIKIELTRKNIAGLLGLTVETTIRTIKKLEAKNVVKIIQQKIYY